MYKPQVSVTTTIARAMLVILLLSITTAGIALFTLFSSQNDAGAINVAGSLRMQSYRLAYDIETQSELFSEHLANYKTSINAAPLKSIESWITPQPLINSYHDLVQRWNDLQPALQSQNKRIYIENVADFVDQIDVFVSELQNFSEFKLLLLTLFFVVGFTCISITAFYSIFYTQKKVVFPLTQLVAASKQVQDGNFRIQLTDDMQNELGILANAFNNMAAELEKHYLDLEYKIQEKTCKLKHANTSLETLYGCAQEFSVSSLDEDNFRNILERLLATDGLTAIRLVVVEELGAGWDIEVGKPSLLKDWHLKHLYLDGEILGQLEWQITPPYSDSELISNVIPMITRGIYYNRAQKYTQQLLLMEERATIARELHDSIAQSLSYLKIQTTLLNRSLDKTDLHQSKVTAKEIKLQLNATYTHLRELISTFRLTIDNANFGEALKELLDSLDEQTSAKLLLDNQLASVALRANHQVHVLQIIREAVINAIKHAKASQITVSCIQNDQSARVTITDNGIGFCAEITKPNHYGLSIITERSQRLDGKVTIARTGTGGCQVQLCFPIKVKAKNE